MKGLAFALIAAVLCSVGCKGTRARPFSPRKPKSIEISIEGNQNFDGSTLKAVVTAELGRSDQVRPSKSDVDDAAFELEVFYLDEGFPSARVDYEFVDLPGAPVRALFRVAEGPRAHVTSLTLDGVRAFDVTELRRFFGQAARGGAFVLDRIEASVSELTDFYLEQGHMLVSVERPGIRFDETRTGVEVTVSIVEGPRFAIEDVAFEGGLVELKYEEEKIALRYENVAYVPRLPFELRAVLRDVYGRRGRPDCTVSVDESIDEETGSVTLAVRVDPGEAVVIKEIEYQGNERTRTSVIRRFLELSPGDAFDSRKVVESSRELYSTGLFETVSVGLKEASGGERTLLIKVSEAPTRELRFEPGWGSYEGPRFAVSVDELNFLGSGRHLTVTGSVSPKAQGGRIGLLDPRFLGSRTTGGASVFAYHREEPSYTTNEVGVGTFLGWRWLQHFGASTGYEFRLSDLVQADTGVIPPGVTTDPNIGSLYTTAFFDDRDNILLPTEGRHVRGRVEWADEVLGSATDFVRTTITVSHAVPVTEETILAAGVRTGIIVPYGSTTLLPIQERFFNGGENTVRSFREDQLGPRDPLTGAPVGGETFSVLNLEIRQRLPHTNFSGAMFVDAGNVGSRVEDYFEDFRVGLGFGLRYLLPIGPMRLDFGLNPNARQGEEDFVVHFAVGLPF